MNSTYDSEQANPLGAVSNLRLYKVSSSHNIMSKPCEKPCKTVTWNDMCYIEETFSKYDYDRTIDHSLINFNLRNQMRKRMFRQPEIKQCKNIFIEPEYSFMEEFYSSYYCDVEDNLSERVRDELDITLR